MKSIAQAPPLPPFIWPVLNTYSHPPVEPCDCTNGDGAETLAVVAPMLNSTPLSPRSFVLAGGEDATEVIPS